MKHRIARAIVRASSRRGRHIVASLLLTLLPDARAADMAPYELAIPLANGQTARASVFEFDPGQYRLQVLAVRSHKTTGMSLTSGIAVRDALQLPAIANLMRREALVVNGGFSAGQTDLPNGLLISDGVAATGPNFAPAAEKATCSLAQTTRLRHSGLLCVDQRGQLQIGPLTRMPYESCRQAIQAGPLLVESGQVAVCQPSADERRYARTVVCVVNGKARVVISPPVTLHEMAQALANPFGTGRAGCQEAINLSGDTSSGAWYAAPGSKVRAPRLYGTGSFPLPSLFVVSRL